MDELELLAVVWSLEHVKYYLFGSHFTLQTDHQALLSAQENSRRSKTYQSRLTRWVDRLLPFHFNDERIAGKDMGFADYLSRHPISPPTGENMNENHVINTLTAVKYALHTKHRKLTLNYALARERGQANQQKMNSSHSPIYVDNPWFEKVQYIKRKNRSPILPTPQTGQIQNCRRCGNKFLQGHLNICPAKNEACRICKKIGHCAKLCRSEMPPRPIYIPQQKRQQNSTGTQPQQRCNQLAPRQRQQKNRNINEETETDDQTETEETIDPESTCYIREMMEDWQNINFIKSVNFTNEKVSDINKTGRGEFWIKTRTNNQQVFWLADTGSPRSIMITETACKLLVNEKTLDSKILNDAIHKNK